MKAISRLIVYLFITLGVLSSCEKELSTENSGIGISTGTGVYTFRGAKDSCSAPSLSGSYTIGTATNGANTVELKINVTSVGTYSISTPQINGLTFTASGTFVATGAQTIVFTASGTPVIRGTFPYSPGNNGCSFFITVNPPGTTNNNTAIFTFPLAPAACSPDTISGTYMAGLPLTAANTVKIQINVSKPGTYSLSTASADGISFVASGSFINTGLQFVLLTGTGKPTAAGPFSFSPGTNGCSFLITVTPPAPPATFTFPSAPNACNPVTIKGACSVGVALTAANTAAIQVNVTTVGSYTISTANSNGISFTSSGVFTATGLQTITFTGSGTPAAAGSFNYTPGSNGCSFPITVTAGPGPSVYTLQNTGGNCSNYVVAGNYVVAMATTAANTVTIKVDVTTSGTFTINSDTVNGISFSAVGVFPQTGQYNVVLNCTGTPISAETDAYNLNLATGGCSLNITTAATLPNGIYNCKINGVYTDFSNRAAASLSSFGSSELDISGYGGQPNGPTGPHLQLFITNNNNSTVQTGTYNQTGGSLSLNGYMAGINYTLLNPDGSTTIYGTSSNPFAVDPPFTIVVSSISATRATGTFSGKVTNLLEGGTITKTITEGVFDVPVQ